MKAMTSWLRASEEAGETLKSDGEAEKLAQQAYEFEQYKRKQAQEEEELRSSKSYWMPLSRWHLIKRKLVTELQGWRQLIDSELTQFLRFPTKKKRAVINFLIKIEDQEKFINNALRKLGLTTTDTYDWSWTKDKSKKGRSQIEEFALQVSLLNASIADAAMELLPLCALDDAEREQAMAISQEFQTRVAKRKPDDTVNLPLCI